MALSSNDPEAGRSAREVAEAAIARIIERGRSRPIADDRSEDEILGYDENGLPS